MQSSANQTKSCALGRWLLSRQKVSATSSSYFLLLTFFLVMTFFKYCIFQFVFISCQFAVRRTNLIKYQLFISEECILQFLFDTHIITCIQLLNKGSTGWVLLEVEEEWERERIFFLMNFTTLEISLLASLNPTTQVGKYILLLLLGVVYMYVGR